GRRGSPRQGQAGRLAASESVIRSGLVLGSGAVLPARECMLIATLIHHPALMDEYFDEVGQLDPGARELEELLRALLEAVAIGEADSPSAIRAVIARLGLGAVLDKVMDRVHRTRSWPALETAALTDARDAFAQALH